MTEDFLRWFARWVDPNIGRVEQGVQCAAAWAAWRARATLHPLERLKQVTAERDQARAQYEALLKAIVDARAMTTAPLIVHPVAGRLERPVSRPVDERASAPHAPTLDPPLQPLSA